MHFPISSFPLELLTFHNTVYDARHTSPKQTFCDKQSIHRDISLHHLLPIPFALLVQSGSLSVALEPLCWAISFHKSYTDGPKISPYAFLSEYFQIHDSTRCEAASSIGMKTFHDKRDSCTLGHATINDFGDIRADQRLCHIHCIW